MQSRKMSDQMQAEDMDGQVVTRMMKENSHDVADVKLQGEENSHRVADIKGQVLIAAAKENTIAISVTKDDTQPQGQAHGCHSDFLLPQRSSQKSAQRESQKSAKRESQRSPKRESQRSAKRESQRSPARSSQRSLSARLSSCPRRSAITVALATAAIEVEQSASLRLSKSDPAPAEAKMVQACSPSSTNPLAAEGIFLWFCLFFFATILLV